MVAHRLWSEEVEWTTTDPAGNPIDAAGIPLAAAQLPDDKGEFEPFIARVGTVAILMLYLGFPGALRAVPDQHVLVGLLDFQTAVRRISCTKSARRAGCKARKYPDGIVAFFVLGCACR
ncbi:hypothetical protein LPU83_3482 [Rhizobium favelukesii]|uniref:Uncharacterized protein n=1 Tax=Rhizobium favelukesii TaxID=348824 RepID=W6RXX7_9HYPH|nr:hypothetical protein LPU83_3482 [Rhizobium favelukesii]